MKPVSQLDQWERELEEHIRHAQLDREALEKTVLEAAGNGGLMPSRPPRILWRWSIGKLQQVCVELEERGVLSWVDGLYVKDKEA